MAIVSVDILKKLETVKKYAYVLAALLSFLAYFYFLFSIDSMIIVFLGFILGMVLILDNNQVQKYFNDIFKKGNELNN